MIKLSKRIMRVNNMPKISLCIEPVFPELPIYDRVRKAADAGYQAVELWDPSAVDTGKLAAAAAACGVSIVSCTLNVPLARQSEDLTQRVRGFVDSAIDLGCQTLIGLSGETYGPPEEQKKILIDNLKCAADIATASGITIALEPLNSLVDHKGCFLNKSALGFEIVKFVGCPNVRLLYDIYHMQIMEGNLIANISANIGLIAHFHAAGVPSRHEPTHSEINYAAVLRAIDTLGYGNYVGLEYWPAYDCDASIRDCLAYMNSSKATLQQQVRS